MPEQQQITHEQGKQITLFYRYRYSIKMIAMMLRIPYTHTGAYIRTLKIQGVQRLQPQQIGQVLLKHKDVLLNSMTEALRGFEYECPKCNGGPLYQDKHDLANKEAHCDDCGVTISQAEYDNIISGAN